MVLEKASVHRNFARGKTLKSFDLVPFSLSQQFQPLLEIIEKNRRAKIIHTWENSATEDIPLVHALQSRV